MSIEETLNLIGTDFQESANIFRDDLGVLKFNMLGHYTITFNERLHPDTTLIYYKSSPTKNMVPEFKKNLLNANYNGELYGIRFGCTKENEWCCSYTIPNDCEKNHLAKILLAMLQQIQFWSRNLNENVIEYN